MAALCIAGTVQATPWTDTTGPLLSTGIGFSPIYIEEITLDNSLVGGATVLPIHVRTRYGTHIRPDLVLMVTADVTGYTDAERNIYASTLLGVGAEVILDDFFNTRINITAGYADKRIFGAGLSASGWGFGIGFTQPIMASFAFDAGYLFRNYSQVASTMLTGEAEHSSAISLGLSYRWQ